MLEVQQTKRISLHEENAISEVLLQEKTNENNFSEEEEEDTVDEAPSIVDEVLAKDNTPTYGSDQSVASKSSVSKNWSAAENVVVLVEADIKLKEAQKEGLEINEVIQKAKEEDEPKEKVEPAIEVPKTSHLAKTFFAPIAKDIKQKQVSHFKAMALLGKMFFSMKKEETIKEETESTKSESGSSYEDDSDFEEDEEEEEDSKEKEKKKESPDNEETREKKNPEPENITENKSKEVASSNETSKGIVEEQLSEQIKSQTDHLHHPEPKVVITKPEETIEKESEPDNLCQTKENAQIKSQNHTENEESESEASFESEEEEDGENESGEESEEESEEESAEDDESGEESEETSPEPPEKVAESPAKKMNHFQALTLLSRIFKGKASKAREKSAIKVQDLNEMLISNANDSSCLPKTEISTEQSSVAQTKEFSSSLSIHENESKVVDINKINILAEVHASADVQESKSVELNVEFNIDMNDPEVSNAATKIQSGFRGQQARKEVALLKEEQQKQDCDKVENKNLDIVDIDMDDPEVSNAATKIQSGFRGKQARKEVALMKDEKDKNEKDRAEETEEPVTIDIDMDDPEVSNAATKIQSGFRGKQARKEVALMKGELQDQGTVKNDDNVILQNTNCQNNFDIDLDDPEYEQAATKIQSGFRGQQARKQFAEMKGIKSEVPEEVSEVEVENNTIKVMDTVIVGDEEAERAATVLQAGYRGMEARKQVADMKAKRNKQIEGEESLLFNGKEELQKNEINLEDPEVEKAATVLQAGYRGMEARKQVAEMKAEKQKELSVTNGIDEDSIASCTHEKTVEIEINMEDPDVEKAATLIQA